MDSWPNFWKGIREQSPYYNMVFALICLFIIVSPGILDEGTLAKYPEFVEFRKEYIAIVSIVFVVCFVYSVGTFLKRGVDYCKYKALLSQQKKEELKLRKDRKALLSVLKSIEEESKNLDSKEDVINWGAKVLAYLTFDPYLHGRFIENLDDIVPKVSALIIDPAMMTMKGLVRMGIEQLEKELGQKHVK